MATRKGVSHPNLATLGKFQGTIDQTSNFRAQALNHNLGRNVRVLKVLLYLCRMVQMVAGFKARWTVLPPSVRTSPPARPELKPDFPRPQARPPGAPEPALSEVEGSRS